MKIKSCRLGKILSALFVSFFFCFQGQGFSADGTSFNPTTVSIVAQSTIPVGTVISWPSGINPYDAPKWLECNGQAVPPGSQYDRLRAVLGGQPLPNYDGQFLRGTTNVASVGANVSDSIKTHVVSVPGQNAPVTGSLISTSLSGTASPQHFQYVYWNWSWSEVHVRWEPEPYQFPVGNSPTVDAWTDGGSVSGNLNNGNITGVANVSAQTGTYTGGTETAPVHTKVRYLMRAIP